MAQQNNLLLEVKNLKTYFFLDEGILRAVDGVSFDIKQGMILGIIGESGCGKSVTSQSILRIVPPPGRIVTGDILLHLRNGDAPPKITNLVELDPQGKKMQEIRGKEISMIFQEPMTSLGPLHTIGNQITETILLHQDISKREARKHVIELLGTVGIPRPDEHIDAYPHQLSGGMRQRAMIAMALSCNPKLLIADEPTTALDVTIQAQILELLKQLQEELGMSIIYITHNLAVVSEIADEVAVMYLGNIVEQTSVEKIFSEPLHPYTRALWRSIPRIDGELSQLVPIKGVVPSPYEIPSGCVFHPRCGEVIPEVCNTSSPPLVEVAPGHKVSCFRYCGA